MSFNDGFNTRAVPWPQNTPVSGNSLVYNGNRWVAADVSGSGGGGGGDITDVNAGTNLTGGGSSGAVTLSLSSSISGLTNIQTTLLTASQISSSTIIGTASFATDLANKTNLVSTLTYDPFILNNSPTTFNNWTDLWTAYQKTSGSVNIFLEQGVVVSAATASYDFRESTKISSHKYSFGAQTLLTIPDGTVFKNLRELDSVKLEASSSTAVLQYSIGNPHLMLSNGSTLISNKNAPVIFWNSPSTASILNITLGYNAKLESGSYPAIQISGSSYTSSVNLVLGQGCAVESNTLAGNLNSDITIAVRDGSNQFSFNQPSLSGTINGNSFNANSTFDLDHPNTILSTKQLHTEQLNIFSPTLGFAPTGIFQAFTTQTTSSTPIAFSLLSIPPIISGLLEIYIVARDTAASDTAAWKYKSMIIGDGTGASFGSLGLVQDFYDYTSGSATWSVSSSLNNPLSGDIRFYGVGENGKTINWGLYQTVTIVLGI